MSKLQDLITDLAKANQALKEAGELLGTRIHKDATIQRFEFTFELCWKTMQEYIRQQGFDCKSPKNCFRTAAQIDLISDPAAWLAYLKARNFIAHTYSEKLADQVYQEAKAFSKAVDQLLEKLKRE